MKRSKRDPALEAAVQNAVNGYQINIMDLSKVYTVAEAAQAQGLDVKTAVHALLDVIAVKVNLEAK